MAQAMRTEGHTPDLMTYNCLLAAHRKQGDWEAALAILDHMLLKGDDGAWRRGAVDEYTCTALMQVRASQHSRCCAGSGVGGLGRKRLWDGILKG